MDDFSIKDIENLSGIKAHTIRIWEQRYNFLKPSRTTTNIRWYCNEELKVILNIALLSKYGYKISHIDRMSGSEINDCVLALTDPSASRERLINELVKEMIEMNMESFESILTRFIRLHGIETVVREIIFPFLEKIGILWQTGHIDAAREHLVTNIIRQKLIVAIESAGASGRMNKTFMLFLPEGEYHELGLLFMNYILKCRGAHTIYLGANVPLKDVEYVVAAKCPDTVFVHLTATCDGFNFEKFLLQTSRRCPQTTIVVSGYLARNYKRKLPPNVQLKRSLSEVVECLNCI
jgi:DNA-binding transcriptional MerR regulator